MHWYLNPSSGDLYFPDESHATNLGEDATVDDAQEWSLTIVDDVGLANLTDQQMMWLLAMTMEQVTLGPPPSMQ
jgi:hypothetical protein